MPHKRAKWLRHPCHLGDPHRFGAGGESEVAHLWAKWLRHPCRLGDPPRFRAGGKVRSGPVMSKVATSPLLSRRSPPLESRGGGDQKWPISGQSGHVTLAVSGIPTALERGGGGSEVAHLWAKWLRHPCCLGDPHRFRAGGKIRSGPIIGKVATSSLPSRGSPPLESGGGGDQKWPTSGQNGYITPAVSGIGGALEGGGGDQKWPTKGQSGYVTPAVSGIPIASERGAKSEVAHLWAKWLRHPCRLMDPHHFIAGGKSEGAHKWAKWLRHPCRLGDPHRFRAGGENQKWPTSGQSGYVTPAISEIPTASERGREIRSGPQVGKVATCNGLFLTGTQSLLFDRFSWIIFWIFDGMFCDRGRQDRSARQIPRQIVADDRRKIKREVNNRCLLSVQIIFWHAKM